MSKPTLSASSIITWRIIQTIVWFIGSGIFFCLVFYPSLGILLFWNILIPVAPALLVVATGLWRNVCPLATTVLLPRHLNLSKRKKMSTTTQAILQLTAIILLFAIVPVRHALFNTNGWATAILLFAATVTGITMGFIYDWKSGWCSSLCPVHPVEKLYGGNTAFTLPNAHCDQCVNCSVPCPDSTPNIHPSIAKKTIWHKISGALTIGGLPGFIWGWFHVPDNGGIFTWINFFDSYTMPLIGLSVTLIIYLVLKEFINGKNERLLVNSFAAAGVSCYYWYRIPSLLGFGKFTGDGLLISLKNVLPESSILLTVIATTVFFFWWFLFRSPNQKSWVIRPGYAEGENKIDLQTVA